MSFLYWMPLMDAPMATVRLHSAVEKLKKGETLCCVKDTFNAMHSWVDFEVFIINNE